MTAGEQSAEIEQRANGTQRSSKKSKSEDRGVKKAKGGGVKKAKGREEET
jgi:hypothetical protein